MGKPTGFMEYKREVSVAEDPKKRIQHFNEFHEHLPKEKQRLQGARCMECGVPFCQSGMMICGMASGCPLHNLVPEWNDLVYSGNWQQAYNLLCWGTALLVSALMTRYAEQPAAAWLKHRLFAQKD